MANLLSPYTVHKSYSVTGFLFALRFLFFPSVCIIESLSTLAVNKKKGSSIVLLSNVFIAGHICVATFNTIKAYCIFC